MRGNRCSNRRVEELTKRIIRECDKTREELLVARSRTVSSLAEARKNLANARASLLDAQNKVQQANRIVLLDRDSAFRELLHRELETDGRFQVDDCDPREPVGPRCQKAGAHLLLCNLRATQEDSTAIIQNVREASPEVRILLVSGSERACWPNLVKAIKAGADGSVLTSEPFEQLLAAVTIVSQGGKCFSPETEIILNDEAFCAVAKLTQRQRDVLRLIAEGFSTREISAQLSICEKTADHHRSRVMKRLHLHDAVSVTRFAVRSGLIEP